jgi:50S ribosomal protein L16 3-hydroxylase
MIFKNTTITPDQFLSDYWQKKPLLIRQAIPDFKPQLDANDIAGLACDELAESRLVTGNFEQQNWALRYGPFSETDFEEFPDTHWTLLVQDVEKHYPPAQEVMKLFKFLPSWRIDDLMVSVAGPAGSVGPHLDQYDVFLLQAAGSRRWEIAEAFDPELLPGCELNVLQRFTAEQEWLLEPGDLLYLPPNVAHHGIAIDAGMTWSIGMRAPSAADLMLALGEWLADTPGEGGRFRDPGLLAATHIGEIDKTATLKLLKFLGSSSQGDPKLTSFLGSFLSRYRLAHEPASPADTTTPATLVRSLDRGDILRHNPWTRLLWLDSDGGAHLFAAGSEYACPVEFARIVCDPALLGQPGRNYSDQEKDLLCALLNRGHLYFEQL